MRWIRIALLLCGIVAVVVAAHRAADAEAKRRLAAALDRLSPPRGAPGSAAAEARPGEHSPIIAGLHDAITGCRAALGADRFDLMSQFGEEPEPTSTDELRSIVADSREALSRLDAALATSGGRLPAVPSLAPLEFGDLLDLGRLCRADVRVRLDERDFDAAARSVRRMSALADALEQVPTFFPQLLRFSLVARACHEARAVLERAPHPAALGDLAPSSPSGALRVAFIGEAERLRGYLERTLDDEIDAASLTGSENFWALASELSLPFAGPWIKFGLLEYVEYMIEVGNHLEPTAANLARLRSLSDAMRTDGNRFVRPQITDFSRLLRSEIEACERIAVLRAGALAWAHFRERGAWPDPAVFGTAITVVPAEDGIELVSTAAPDVAWKLSASRESGGVRDR